MDQSELEQLSLDAFLQIHGSAEQFVRKLKSVNENLLAKNKELVATNEGLVQQTQTLAQEVQSLASGKLAVENRELVARNEELMRRTQALNEEVRAFTERFREQAGQLQVSGVHSLVGMTIKPTPQAKIYQPNLPNEILRMIFVYAIPPSEFVDPNLYGGPESPWCLTLRTKKSLTLVCKAWWSVAMDVLYEEVAFRRPWQIAAFSRTLETSLFDCCSYVRKFDVACLLALDSIASIESDLAQILCRCTRITQVRWNPCLDDGVAPGHPFDRVWHPWPNLNLTHLECGPTVDFPSLAVGLQDVGRTLLSLSFTVPPTRSDTPPIDVRLDRLESLHMQWLEQLEYSHLESITTQWSMPQLKALTVDNSAYWRKSTVLWLEFCPALISFCKAHGKGIDYLRIHVQNVLSPEGIKMPSTDDYQPILDACPSLQHLVLDAKSGSPLSHPRIQWVDVEWMDAEASHGPESSGYLGLMLNTKRLPSLKGVRVIDRPLHFIRDLPRMVPPQYMLGEHTDFEWRFPGVHICHRKGRVYRADMQYLEDEEDSDYEYPSADSSADDSAEDSSSDEDDDYSTDIGSTGSTMGES
ncbi:hypothetical protein PLICRDRAFT_170924 [Plicaturopsis crispa FD-325 SS-3]|nr:hypothetical protein PLICRDRAFT_170924 [Plicaturopsis crispa FD-325 SS-3]